MSIDEKRLSKCLADAAKCMADGDLKNAAHWLRQAADAAAPLDKAYGHEHLGHKHGAPP